MDVGSNQTNYFYVQFNVNRQGVLDLFNNSNNSNITHIETYYDENGNAHTQTIVSQNNNDNSKGVLKNAAEINSYTSFYDEGGSVAVVDTDSVPGNANPANVDGTYEDDTDASRDLKLVRQESRDITGIAFVDGILSPNGWETSKLMTGEERKGDGTYGSGDQPLKGVEVTLYEVNKEGNGYSPKEITKVTTTTNDQGEFEFKYDDQQNKALYTVAQAADGTAYDGANGIKAGNYVIIYTWGDKTYMVQYYKGTVYVDTARYTANYGTSTSDANHTGMNGNKYWYRDNVATRLQDAVDDYNTRTNIDAEMKINSQTGKVWDNTLREHIDTAYKVGDPSITITKMNSQTPVMSFDVERDADTSETNDDGSDDKDLAKYQVQNIDFGIAERPRQELQLLKRVVGYRMVLANGQEMFKVSIDRQNDKTKFDKNATEPKYYTYEYKINGTRDYTIFQDLGQIDKSGMITTQLDSEIIEGATVEITYEMLITNMSELDYATPNYYYCGQIDNASKDIVRISVYSLTDYLDNKLTLRNKVDKLSNGLFNGWGEITSDELKNELKSLSADDLDYIKDKYLLNNNSLYYKFLAPKQTETIELPTSKVLTTAQDKTYSNRADITQVDKKGFEATGTTEFNLGTPVNIRNNSISYNDAETVSIIPPTGENKNYKLPITVGIVALVVLGVGIFLIRKVVIKSRKNKAE